MAQMLSFDRLLFSVCVQEHLKALPNRYIFHQELSISRVWNEIRIEDAPDKIVPRKLRLSFVDLSYQVSGEKN
ncbi:hypothetical protein WJ32_24625 [Burkholderia ubonensis]|uniref:Uncharacterized protein n=1 Tax=Burkholderia ubonensis TaxID=101571 RepID=A0A103QZ25_9BURK|nr:hypothetical protein WJ32_24625 [Burkholderia ubonensis]KVG58183.1 hypothetical protein WJ33_34590 [Burkholderia ubonensis]